MGFLRLLGCHCLSRDCLFALSITLVGTPASLATEGHSSGWQGLLDGVHEDNVFMVLPGAQV